MPACKATAHLSPLNPGWFLSASPWQHNTDRPAASAAANSAAAAPPPRRPSFLLALLRPVGVGDVTMRPLRQSVVELGPVFSGRECVELIARAGAEGFAPWPANSETPFLDLCPLPDESLCELVRDRLAEAFRRAPGVELLRLARPPAVERFEAGQGLPPGPAGEAEGDGESRLVVVVRLNEGFGRGETVCYLAAGPLTFAPWAGEGVAFPAFLTREELPVSGGCKYLLRAEVVIRKDEG